MISPPTKTFQFHQAQRIAQLLLLPCRAALGHTGTQSERQKKGFGSSDMAFWIKEIAQKRPMETIMFIASLWGYETQEQMFLYFRKRLALLLAHTYY